MGGKASNGRRCTIGEGYTIGITILHELDSMGATRQGMIAGSIRRQQTDDNEMVGDIDLVVQPADVDVLGKWLRDHFGVISTGVPKRTGLIEGVQVDVMISPPEAWGAACMHCTGSVRTNIRMRSRAMTLGMKLNERGLWKKMERVAGATEEEVYKALGTQYVQPTDR